MKQQLKQKGFSMVELAIVLAIIALIIGAVAVGKDLQRNAEYKRITNKFVGQWAQAYNQYYERTGVVIGDNLQVPTGEVGGNNTGNMAGAVLVQEMEAKGIRVPQGNGRGSGDANGAIYVYLDQAGIPHTLTIGFAYSSAGINSIIGNMMTISQITPKLGATMDMMIDGIIESDAGFFRGNSSNAADTAADSTAWGVGASSASEEVAESDYFAVWKMNQ